MPWNRSRFIDTWPFNCLVKHFKHNILNLLRTRRGRLRGSSAWPAPGLTISATGNPTFYPRASSTFWPCPAIPGFPAPKKPQAPVGAGTGGRRRSTTVVLPSAAGSKSPREQTGRNRTSQLPLPVSEHDMKGLIHLEGAVLAQTRRQLSTQTQTRLGSAHHQHS